jgi:hypothetical protein
MSIWRARQLPQVQKVPRGALRRGIDVGEAKMRPLSKPPGRADLSAALEAAKNCEPAGSEAAALQGARNCNASDAAKQ